MEFSLIITPPPTPPKNIYKYCQKNNTKLKQYSQYIYSFILIFSFK